MIFEKGKDPFYHRNFQLHFLMQYGLKPHHVFLDYGCGECITNGELTRLGVFLVNYLDEGRYWGLDVRESVIENCRRFINSSWLREKKPHLIHIKDMKNIKLSEKFDYIWCFSVVIHMTDEVFNDFLNFASNHLKGDLYMNVNIAPRNIRCYWKGFPVVERPITFYKDLAAKHGLEAVDVGSLESFGYRADPASNRQRILRLRRR